MLGLAQPCRCQLTDDLVQQWRAHLCGLCLTLRDDHGQLARSVTNTDAVLVSVLVEAQSRRPAERVTAGRCALRGMRTAEVVPAAALSARLGATASLTLASAKAADVVGEARHGLSPHPVLAGRAARALAPRLREHALRDAEVSGPLGVVAVLDELAEQAAIEVAVRPGDDLDAVTEPAARACAAVFETAAVLAGVPGNAAPLAAVGHDYGRLAHLLDALTDLDDDQRAGAFNPVLATATPVEQVLRRCRELAARIRTGLDGVALVDDRLVRVLLVDSVRSAVHRVVASRRTGRRPVLPNVLPWIGVYCTGYALCASHEDPCTGERRSSGCSSCGECADCGSCCSCDGCCCDGCACDC